MSGLKSFAPEICSLICQDPILQQRDLKSICFISHTFRKEAQRLLSYRFPCLRDAGRVKAWCLSLKRRPHIALDIQSLVLFLPPQAAFYADDILRLMQALRMCVNLKELVVLPESGLQDYSKSVYMLEGLPFQLTKFVNGYFMHQPSRFNEFIQSQQKLEILEMHNVHSGKMRNEIVVYHPYVKTLACHPRFSLGEFLYFTKLERLRLDFGNSMDESEICVFNSIYCWFPPGLKSLAIFLKQRSDGKQSHLLEIMAFMAAKIPEIRHLQIHQFLPILESSALFFSSSSFSWIETLVLRPPPRLPKKSGDDPNLCAYVKLRTAYGRREAAEKIMKNLPTLTRLVFIDYQYDYEFRRDMRTGIITGEEAITLDKQEWALW